LSTRTKVFVVAAALAVVVLVLARGEEPSEQMQALRDDPMASYAPTGGRLVDTESQNEGTSLGRPVLATYTRLFQLPGGSAGPLEDARSAAAAAGWELTAATAGKSVVGSKRVGSGPIELTLVLVEDPRLLPKDVKSPALSVSLRHLGR
jgi:hypothetical protein